MLLSKAKALRKGDMVTPAATGRNVAVKAAHYDPRAQAVTVDTVDGRTYLHTQLSNREMSKEEARLNYLRVKGVRLLDAQAGRFHHAEAMRALLAQMPTSFDPAADADALAELYEACKRYVAAHKDVNLLSGKTMEGK